MGKSFTAIDIRQALQTMDSMGMKVVSASKETYFHNNKWKAKIAFAMLEDEGSIIEFRLDNQDFVEVEAI